MNKWIYNECLHYASKISGAAAPNKFSIYMRQSILRKFEMPYIEFFITTKCNLRCKNCSNLIPSLESPSSVAFEDFTNTLNSLLAKTDRLYRLKLHGGEVFLHPQLSEIIDFADKQPKIKSIRLTTNGTIIPRQTVLDAIKNSKAVVQISDYNLSNTKAAEFINVLKANNIPFAYLKSQVWKDMGDFAKRTTNRFHQCAMRRCTSILDGKVYVCSRAAIMTKLGIISDCGIPLTRNKTEFQNSIIDLYSNENIACLYCDGDSNFAQQIIAGEQLK